jgi:class 3 adenylate cyclase
VRMGLHTGEPLITEDGYVGIDVHRAARIAAAGHGGQGVGLAVHRDLARPDLPEISASIGSRTWTRRSGSTSSVTATFHRSRA